MGGAIAFSGGGLRTIIVLNMGVGAGHSDRARTGGRVTIACRQVCHEGMVALRMRGASSVGQQWVPAFCAGRKETTLHFFVTGATEFITNVLSTNTTVRGGHLG